jgi:Homeodomain-like domain
LLGAWRHPVLMVGTDPVEVDRVLAGGGLRCPECAGELRPWGYARSRGVRDEDAIRASRPRRSSCSQCRRTHVLLPASMLVRRADTVLVIGAALLAKAAGLGHRRVAVVLGRPQSTVRGWLRRFTGRAESVRVMFTGLLHALDGPLQRRLRPVRCSVTRSRSWVWRQPRRPGCSGPDRHGSSPPRQAVVCCWAPVCCWARAGRPTRADPGQRPATPTAFGLADHDVITRSWRPDGPQSTAGPQRRTGPGRSR